MSRYKAYPAYKATRHSWLENVPAHWEMLPLKFLTAQHVTDGPHETPEFIDEGVPFLSVDGIQNNQLVFEGCRYISREDHARYSIKCKPNQGDVLLGKAASVGKVAHVDTDIEFNVWSPLAVIRPRSKKTGRFIYYSLQSALLQMQCDMYSNANTQKNLGMSTIDNLVFASPTDDESEKIAAFLDHETAKIDALIEKQQRLIELLKEKRQAVISHAVTKGHNPNAPMKDSGVEWLGEVPAHWIVCRLKHAIKSGSSISYGIVQPGEPLDDGVPFVQTTNMSRGSFGIDDLQKTTKEIAAAYPRSTLEGGEVILGIRASIGAAYVVPENLKGVNLSRGVARIIPGMSLLSSYLVLFFGTDAVSRYWELSKQGSTFSEVSIETVREMSLLIPPKSEQIEIEASIKQRLSKMDFVLNLATNKVSLLQERRTALISAAVTGKIDVRDWQPAAAQAGVGIDG